MAAIAGLKEEFLKGRRDLVEKVLQFKREGKSWQEIEDFLRKEFERDLSFLKPNLFTYFLLVGGTLLLPFLYLWKVVFPPGTTAHFITRLIFVLAAMFSLKGIVGHYVIVFLNRDRFEEELKALKVSIEGGKDGNCREQPN